MIYDLVFTNSYKVKEKRFLKSHRDLADIYAKTLVLLRANPAYPSLRLHKLKGKMREYYSISINMQYRIVIDFIITNRQIILIDIGDHDIYIKQ